MSVFGTAVYGTDVYGPDPAQSPTGALQWVVQVDWTGGGFTGVNEAPGRLCAMSVKRGREFYIASGADNFEPMAIWPCTLTLENYDGRYDPYNTSSPLYPYVAPGRRIKIQVRDVGTGTLYDILAGHIFDIQPVSDNARRVTFTVYDAGRWLKDQNVDLASKLNTTVSASVTNVILAAKYPYGKAVGSWAQPIPVFDANQYNAFDTLNDLAAGSLGTFFIASNGAAKYYPLNYNGMASHDLDQAQLLKAIKVATPWENVRNIIKVIARRRGRYPSGILWSAGGAIYVPKYSTNDFDISYDDAINVLQPSSVTDFAANTKADGTGTVISFPWAQVVVSKIGTTSAHVRLWNLGGTDCYFTFINIYGSKIVEIPVTYKSDVSAGSLYGPRRFELNNSWLQDSGYAKAFSTLLSSFLKSPAKNPVVQIENRPSLQFPIDLMDHVDLTSAKLDINNTYSVGGIEHEWLSDNGQAVRTTLYLQSVIYSGSSITSDPFYPPAVPPVPPYSPPTDPPPPGDPPNPPQDPPGDPCATTLTSPANGPFDLGINATIMTDTPASGVSAQLNCLIRSSSHTYKTTLVISGIFEHRTGTYPNFIWEPDLTTDHMICEALDAGGATICTGTWQPVTDNGTGTRMAIFELPAATEVQTWRLYVTGGTAEYYIIPPRINSGGTGGMPVTEEGGIELLNNADHSSVDPLGYFLSDGLYAVQGINGGWWDGTFLGPERYEIQEGQNEPSGKQYLTFNSAGGDWTDTTPYLEGEDIQMRINDIGYILWDLPGVMPVNTIMRVDVISVVFFIYRYYLSGVEVYNHALTSGDGDYIIPVEFDQVKGEVYGGSYAYTNFSVVKPTTYNFGDGVFKDVDIVTPHQRIYFWRNILDNSVRVEDTAGNYADNTTVDMSFELYHAAVLGEYRVQIASIQVFNVCPPD